MHIGVFTSNATTFERAVTRWRAQAPAYLYVATDGLWPHRPPAQRYLAHTSPVCSPTCSDAELITYWHDQDQFGLGRDGLCQESCRDLQHAAFGITTLVNAAETVAGLDGT